jgi:ATP-binding protein involved in chromosome partitioning
MPSEQDIRTHLKKIDYPGSKHDIVTLGLVGDIQVNDSTVIVQLRATNAKEEVLQHLRARIVAALSAMPDVDEVHVHLPGQEQAGSQQPPAGQQPGPQGRPQAKDPTVVSGVKHIIAVASGKGGVGKSTVAVNLALALGGLGKTVGLLDADVYGPSIPIMMGTEATPRAGQDKKIYPVEKYGVSLISMGFFLDEKSPVIWRGPIVMGIIRQFLRDVIWGDLDYLVVDLPPGTGDIALTLTQEVPLSGGVVVTTPQDVALLDVQRGIAMLKQVNVPILGVIENMSFYVCPECHNKEEIFGHGGAQKTGFPILGEIPLVEDLRVGGDNGKPLVLAQPDHPVSQQFRVIAQHVIEAGDLVVEQQGQTVQ